MTDIHLKSHLYYEISENSSVLMVWIVAGTGFLILVLASINFMNLSTARATKRAKEIGLRKTLGANQVNLILQFMGESIIFCFLAVIYGILLAEAFLPLFNMYLNEELDIQYFNNWLTIPVLVGIALFVGIISGIYPSVILSSFSPVMALKNASVTPNNTGGFLVRKGLVVVQFAVVTFLLVIIISMHQQLVYISNKDVGYDNKEALFLRSSDLMLKDPSKYRSFVEEIRNNEAIDKIAGVRRMDYQTIEMEGFGPDLRRGANIYATSPDFAATLGVRVIAGRLPMRNNATDYEGVIFNETAIKQFGLSPQDAIGKEVKLFQGDSSYTVLAVIQDYHFQDLVSKIEPLVIISEPIEFYATSMIHFKSGRKDQAVQAVTTAWKKYDDGWPFELVVNQEEIKKSFSQVRELQQMMAQLTILGVIIACLGLYALTMFSTERRIKEIGIRKIAGASIFSIWRLILREFTLLVILATLIGLLGGFLVAEIMLREFAYRISIDMKILVSAGAVSIFIAVFTVSYQAIKASMLNPVLTLKSE